MAAAQAGLLLLEWGIPLSALLDLARRHHEATEAVAREAVAMFSTHVRGPLRTAHPPARGVPGAEGSGDEPHIERLLQAYAELLPAVNTLVGHHFTRTLVNVALDHVEQVGSEAEREPSATRRGWPAAGRRGPFRGRRRRGGPVTDRTPGSGQGRAPVATAIPPPSFDAAARAAEADLPSGAEKTALVRSMFDTIAPRYDLVNRMMTFGLDVRWRRQSVRALGLPAGSRVLDLACGTGDFLRILSTAGLVPFGMDLSWGMLAANRTGPAPGPGRRCRAAGGGGVGGRDHLRLRPAQLHRARGRCSASSAGWSVRAAGSACSRWPSPTTACS